MTLTLGLLLLIVAVILFVLSAINTSSARVNLQSAGLACWVLSQLVGLLRV